MTKINQPLQAVEQEEQLTTDEHLEAVLFQFVTLYERWSEDRQVSAKQSADTSKFIKEFAQYVGQFAELEEKVRSDIQTSIRKEAENTAIYFSKTIGDAAYKEIEPTVKKLRAASEEASHVLSRYQLSMRWANLEMVAVSVVSSLLLSLLMIWWFSPKPTLPLTSQQTRYLITGESFNEIWPKLSKAEKERFKKLANENGMIIHS